MRSGSWRFHDSPRTDVSMLESWADPTLIDLDNWLILLPLLAFLASLATVVLAVLALRRACR